MADPSPADRILAKGPRATVEFAVRRNGQMEAKEWLDSQPERTLASFGVFFERLVQVGRIRNETQFRNLQDDVWEFKRKIHRLLCVRIGNRYMLTHRIKKAGGSGKCPAAEIAHAESIGQEHIAWEMQSRKGNQ